MSFLFARGDKVVLKARPEVGMGVVTEVLLAADEPQFEVVFKGGAAQTYSARHLDLAPEASEHADPISLLKADSLADAETFRTFMVLLSSSDHLPTTCTHLLLRARSACHTNSSPY